MTFLMFCKCFILFKGKTPRKPRDPLLRHNSVDDEMRFTGLHTKADIPSKAFQRLTKMAGPDNGTSVTPKQEQNNKGDKNGKAYDSIS